eukprot:symbB.v1.2.026036.t1/scaffold2566.1/size76240/2
MPLSEPMKAAIVLAIVMAVVAAVLGEAIANAAQVLASALGAKPVATYAGVGGFAGGFFEDLVQVVKETACDLVRVILATANMLKNHLPPATDCRCNCLCTKPTFMRLQNVRAKEVPFHRCSFNAQSQIKLIE